MKLWQKILVSLLSLHPLISQEAAVVIGGGVGALTAAIYLGRAGLEPLVVEGKEPGGLLTQSHSVQNWPGEMEIEGAVLTERMHKQAEVSGARFRKEEVIGVDFSQRPFRIQTKSLSGKQTSEILAQTVIIAMGTQPNFLKVPGEAEYWGKGVTNCAICDGSLYRDRVVGVVGGGDSAVLEALYLSNIAKEVALFVRKGELKAIEETRVKSLQELPNVKIFYNTTVEAVLGTKGKVTGVTLKKEGRKVEFPLDGLFLAIGSTPNSALFDGMLQLDGRGYIFLEKDQQTSIEGVYAIGDIVDPVYKQAISAAGDGAKAALQAQKYLSHMGYGLASRKASKQKEANRELARSQKPTTAQEPQTGVIEISSRAQFERELNNGSVPVIVDFYATWCGPCKRISPLIESSATQYSGKVKFLKVNADRFYDLIESYDIRAMPTVLIFDAKGALLDTKVGMDEIADYLQGTKIKALR